MSAGQWEHIPTTTSNTTFTTHYGPQPQVQVQLPGPQIGDLKHENSALFMWTGQHWRDVVWRQHSEPPTQSAPESEKDFDFTDICHPCGQATDEHRDHLRARKDGTDTPPDRFCLFHRGWVQGRLSR